MPTDKRPFEDFGRKLDQGAQRLEQEGEKFIKYFNDEVVPAIRAKSSKGLRVAADKLSQLAAYMEQKNSK